MRNQRQLVQLIAQAVAAALTTAPAPKAKARARKGSRKAGRKAAPVLRFAQPAVATRELPASFGVAADYRDGFNAKRPAACPFCAARGQESAFVELEQHTLKRSQRQVVRAVFAACSHSITMERA